MAITLKLDFIGIHDEVLLQEDGTPPRRLATINVYVGGFGDAQEPLKLVFRSREFQSLDRLVEEVREEIRLFAADLAKAAEHPLQ
jgi:hypothetical protein